jgi:hypothetical protein
LISDFELEEIEELIASLGIYYKGAITILELEHLPITKVFQFNKFAIKREEKIKREIDKSNQRK